jgi:hypothetical protein
MAASLASPLTMASAPQGNPDGIRLIANTFHQIKHYVKRFNQANCHHRDTLHCQKKRRQ